MSAVLASTALTSCLLDGGKPSMVFYTVVVTAILTIATVLNLPGRETARA